MMWQRHSGDSKFHAGAPDGASWKTLCNGRWPLTDAAHGEVECSANPPQHERCRACVERRTAIDAERTEVHMLVDYLLTDDDGEDSAVARIAREVRRMRGELEERTNELHWVERELADAEQLAKVTAVRIPAPVFPAVDQDLVEALVEALQLAHKDALTKHDRSRLRELARRVPQ